MGGETKQIDIYSIPNIEDEESFLDAPELAMKFSSKVTKILWIGNYVMGFSEDSEA